MTEQDKTSRGSYTRDTIGSTRQEHRRLGTIGSKARPDKVIPETGNYHIPAHVRGTWDFEQKMFNVAPCVIPNPFNPRSKSRIRS